MMNAFQIVMLVIIVSFIVTIKGIDQILKRQGVQLVTRRKVSKFLLVLAVFVQCLLTLVLVKFSL
jgi:uncharacterized membrane protein